MSESKSKAREHFILHLDGDAFFASVEIASRPDLRGRAVVTGHERGIATALSYEAKALGVVRGMPVFQIKKLFPQVIILPSHYHAYTLYSSRMKAIVARHVDAIESYSIDECFASVYAEREEALHLASQIKRSVWIELGITVSLGISSTKSLSKLASKYKKPDGLTLIDESNREAILEKTLIGSIWGIGRETSLLLQREGIMTAHDLVEQSQSEIYRTFHKSVREIWHELQGERVHEIESIHEESKSISRSRTFSHPSSDPVFIRSELVHHIEEACAGLRESHLLPRHVYFFLKTKDFRYERHEFRLPSPTHYAPSILSSLSTRFREVIRPDVLYRACGVTLSDLISIEAVPSSLFAEERSLDDEEMLGTLVDSLNLRFGENTLGIASSLRSVSKGAGIQPKPLCIPSLGKVM